MFKNKRTKLSTENPQITEQNLQLRNKLLVLQRKLLVQEIEDKSKITKLTIENLKLDAQIKRQTLQKFNTNVEIDENDENDKVIDDDYQV